MKLNYRCVVPRDGSLHCANAVYVGLQNDGCRDLDYATRLVVGLGGVRGT